MADTQKQSKTTKPTVVVVLDVADGRELSRFPFEEFETYLYDSRFEQEEIDMIIGGLIMMGTTSLDIPAAFFVDYNERAFGIEDLPDHRVREYVEDAIFGTRVDSTATADGISREEAEDLKNKLGIKYGRGAK